MAAFEACATLGIGGSSWGQVGKALATDFEGGIASVLQGGKFGNGFASAEIYQWVQPGISKLPIQEKAIAAALAGGTISKLTGGNFENGALSAAFQEACNEIQNANTVSGPLSGKAAAAEQASAQTYTAACTDGGLLKTYIPDYNPTDGFSACLTLDPTDGQPILAIEGTNSLNDMHHAWPQSLGIATSQYSQAMALARDMWLVTGGNVLFTGHSSGGGMAAAMAAATGGDAITFNAQGYSLPAAGMPRTVTNYYIPGDVLTTLQAILPIPHAVGTQIVYPVSRIESPLGYHSIDNFGGH